MLDAVRIATKIAFAPVWVLWKGYGVLWWAFDDSEKRAAGAPAIAPPGASVPPDLTTNAGSLHTDAPAFGEGQRAAFEFVDSRPRPAPAPVGLLRGGFVGTVLSSTMAGLIATNAVESGSFSHTGGWVLWGWSTLLAAVGSLFLVRHVHRRHEAEKPLTRWQRCKATAGGVKDACFHAAGGVGTAWHATRRGGSAVKKRAAAAVASRPVSLLRRWVSKRPVTQPTRA